MRDILKNTGKRHRHAKRSLFFCFVILAALAAPAVAADAVSAGEADCYGKMAMETGFYGNNAGLFHYPGLSRVGFIRMPQVTPMGYIAG
ncbi:hypothetical protein LJC71_11365, partial [Desulfosarcina sp. OttesenSCG-928-A07]|nr:hypothetical protein [Desulfosarcina sp. OttesenSCG-928-A07]